MDKSEGMGPSEGNRIVIERAFDAPRDMVFACWTDPAHLEKWYGPKGFSTVVDECEARAGGAWRFTLTTPGGKSLPMRGVFEEVDPPRRLVLTDKSAEDMGMDMGRVLMTIDFDSVDGGTKMTLTIILDDVERKNMYERSGGVMGWNMAFDKMAELLEREGDKS